jgi:hypothetical protein
VYQAIQYNNVLVVPTVDEYQCLGGMYSLVDEMVQYCSAMPVLGCWSHVWFQRCETRRLEFLAVKNQKSIEWHCDLRLLQLYR